MDSLIVTPWIFVKDARGEVMHPQSPGRYLSRFGERNSLERCRPHKFRHTMISLMITGGVDVATVAEIVGDEVDTILWIYTHTNEAAKAKAFEDYQAIINGTKTVADSVAVNKKNEDTIRLDK